MHEWTRLAQRGVSSLADHDPAQALRWFGQALECCPVSKSSDLARILFYLGVTFRKLGMGESCIRSWLASQRLDKRGNAGKMLQRFANEYGMERQPTEELDDWQAFLSIHLHRYLAARGRERFSNALEKRLVSDLIYGYWRELLASTDFRGWSPARKRRLFSGVRIAFPIVVARATAEVIPVDFAGRRRTGYDQRCPCGSGRTYSSCCGRIPGPGEVWSGGF